MLNAVPVSDIIAEISEKSEGEGSEVSSHSSGESSRSGKFTLLTKQMTATKMRKDKQQ